MRLAYLAHPVSGLSQETLRCSIAGWVFDVTEAFPDVAFTVPWLAYVLALDDQNPAHRARGMRDDLQSLSRCDEVWLLGGVISAGMRTEAEHAVSICIPVFRVTRGPDGLVREEWGGGA